MSGKIDTSRAAKILGLNVDTILKYRRLGKIKSAQRASGAKQAPWLYDRTEIEGLKNADDARRVDSLV